MLCYFSAQMGFMLLYIDGQEVRFQPRAPCMIRVHGAFPRASMPAASQARRGANQAAPRQVRKVHNMKALDVQMFARGAERSARVLAPMPAATH